MFVRRSTHDRVVAERDGAQIVVATQHRAIERLTAEIERLHAATPERGKRGRFTKREG